MTMRVRITNDDGRRRAAVTIRDATTGAPSPHYVPPRVELAPGESGDFWVHSTQSVLVEEVQ